MAHDGLKRPLLFNVKKTKNPPIALVSLQECNKIHRRIEEAEHYDDDTSAAPAPALPPGALPALRSPRPERIVYVPSPTKTPAYFRWKPKIGNGAVLRSPTEERTARPRKGGPHAPSPRTMSIERRNQTPGTPVATPPIDLRQMGPSLFSVGNGPNDDESSDAFPASRRRSVLPAMTESLDQMTTTTARPDSRRDASNNLVGGITESNLFQYEPLPVTPATPSTSSTCDPGLETGTRANNTSPVAHPSDGPATSVTFVDQHPPEMTESSSNRGNSQVAAAPKAQTLAESAPSADEPLVKPEEVSQSGEAEEDDELKAIPIEFSTSGSRPSQEKAIAQHVLRSKFMRKYLHVNNLARKLKETEQAIRSAALHSGLPTMKNGGSLFSRSFITKTPPAEPKLTSVSELLGSDASTVLGEHVPVLRRLSSIDKAINKTVKRIRRMSGLEDPAALSKQKRSLTGSTNASTRSKFQALKSIGESHQMDDRKTIKLQALDFGNHEAGGNGTGDDDEEVDIEEFDEVETKIDPSSAHMLRICQHVIAKRAIKSFLRQEMSLITIIEVALREEPTLQPPWLLQRQHATLHGRRTPVAHDTDDAKESFHRLPIKAMNPAIWEAVSTYLRQGDQLMTLEELFIEALDAEREKRWKRAILLASACVVIDRDLVLAVLLRARCCRRLGLWAQAIMDLGHAILLRPDEYRLVLLRACLYVRMGDLENALMDTNRTLGVNPKSVDTLLLRADIFHRQNAIGASLQDLTTALLYDPGCWRAYYDRATIRIRAVEGDEQSFNYHWEHMKYEKLLASIIEDYVSALRKGCQMVEVVETIGDLTIRLLEFTGDTNVLRQVINNLSHLLQILAHDHRRSFHSTASSSLVSGSRLSLAGGSSMAAASQTAPGMSAPGSTESPEVRKSSELSRDLLVASIHAQRGRLHMLLDERGAAFSDFDHAVVNEYHYPVAHFYRGAFAALLSRERDEEAMKANLQHLNRCISLDPTIAGAYTVRGALYLRELKFNNALQDFKAAAATDPTLYEVWLQIALIYLNHYHDCEECIKACSSALTNDSCLARALYLRGEAFTRQGNIRAALRDYGRLTMAQPDDRWAQLMQGRLLLQMKLARPALYAFIQFMELGSYAHERSGHGYGPSDKRAHILCGRAYKILSRFQHAVDQFQRAVHLNPTSDNLVLLSESLHSMGDTENSLRVSEKVISTDPGSFKGYVRRAQLLVTIGQFQNALAEYDKALFLAPKEGRIYYERGIVFMQLYMRWRVAFHFNFETKTHASGSSRKKTKRSPFEPRIPAIEVEAQLGTEQINDEATVLQRMKDCYVGAIGDFCKCIRLEPTMAEPYVDRAELYILGEDYEKAFHDYDAAITRNQRCVRAHVNLGVLKCQFSAHASAIADFDQAIRYDPKLSLALFNRAVSYQKLQLWRHAERSYTACIEIIGCGRDIDAHRNRAITRCQIGSYEDAVRDFDEVRQSAPDDDQLHGGLGYALLQLGRYEDAAKCFATYGRLNRDTFADSGNAYFNLGSTQDHLDQKKHSTYLTTALRFYLRAARLHPSNLDVRMNIANCLRRMGQPWQAISQCDTIHKARQLHHESLESKALAFYQMHRLQEAVEWMNAAIRACVASSSALENIFYAFASQSIHRNALERKIVSSKSSKRDIQSQSPATAPSMAEVMNSHLQELRGKHTLSANEKPLAVNAGEIVLTGSSKQMLSLYMLNRGIIYEKLGEWDDAERDYKDALHFDPLSVNAHISIATLLLMRGRYEESKTMFDRAISMEPRNGLAHMNLGVVHLSLDQLDEALQHFDIAITELPTCSYGHANRGVALARQGELKLAESEFKRAIEQLPTRKEYYLTRGKIIAQQKRLQDAMVDFSTALFLGYDGKL